MEQRITDFFEMLRTKRVGLVGFGVTNNGIAKMLAQKGVDVTIHDRQERGELGDICQEIYEIYPTKQLIHCHSEGRSIQLNYKSLQKYLAVKIELLHFTWIF